MKPEWQPILQAATKAIIETLQAGEAQKIAEGKSPNDWMTYPPEKRLHHAFMHLVNCKTHEGITGNPWVLADNTSLEQYKHALTGLAIVAAHQSGLLDNAASVVDTTEDEVKGE